MVNGELGRFIILCDKRCEPHGQMNNERTNDEQITVRATRANEQ